MIKAVIVDDEKHSSETLIIELRRFCQDIDVIASFNDPREALDKIPGLEFDVLFLDIEMPWLNGFELLAALKDIDFEVVFVTAYDQFALQAFRVSALDYLLKPVQEEDIRKICSRILRYKNQLASSRIRHLLSCIEDMNSTMPTVILPTSEGMEFVKKQNIIRCKADSNYCYIFLDNGHSLFLSKTLKEVEEILHDNSFIRVHSSHLVNINHISKYLREDGGCLLMSDKSIVPISRLKRENIMKMLR
jgi:two-component system LytT family response regulator